MQPDKASSNAWITSNSFVHNISHNGFSRGTSIAIVTYFKRTGGLSFSQRWDWNRQNQTRNKYKNRTIKALRIHLFFFQLATSMSFFRALIKWMMDNLCNTMEHFIVCNYVVMESFVNIKNRTCLPVICMTFEEFHNYHIMILKNSTGTSPMSQTNKEGNPVKLLQKVNLSSTSGYENTLSLFHILGDYRTHTSIFQMTHIIKCIIS